MTSAFAPRSARPAITSSTDPALSDRGADGGTWVRPRKSKLVPSVSGWRAPSVICGRKSTRRVLSGWSVSPHRARRLPRTASTRLASTILSNSMIASLANWARVLSPLRRGLSHRRAPLFRSGLPLGGDCRLCSRRLLVFRLGGPRLLLVRLLRRRFGHLGFDGSRQLFSGRVGLALRWAGRRLDGRFGRRLASLVPALRDLRLEPRLGGQPEPLRVALRPSFLLPKIVRDLANKSLVIGHCHLLVSSQPQRSSAAPSPTSRSPRKTLMLRLASASTLRPFFIALGGSNPKK